METINPRGQFLIWFESDWDSNKTLISDSHRPFIWSVSNWNVQYLCRKLLWTVLATSRPRRPPCHACFAKKILQDGNQRNIFVVVFVDVDKVFRVGGSTVHYFKLYMSKVAGRMMFWPVQILLHKMWFLIIIGYENSWMLVEWINGKF